MARLRARAPWVCGGSLGVRPRSWLGFGQAVWRSVVLRSVGVWRSGWLAFSRHAFPRSLSCCRCGVPRGAYSMSLCWVWRLSSVPLEDGNRRSARGHRFSDFPRGGRSAVLRRRFWRSAFGRVHFGNVIWDVASGVRRSARCSGRGRRGGSGRRLWLAWSSRCSSVIRSNCLLQSRRRGPALRGCPEAPATDSADGRQGAVDRLSQFRRAEADGQVHDRQSSEDDRHADGVGGRREHQPRQPDAGGQ